LFGPICKINSAKRLRYLLTPENKWKSVFNANSISLSSLASTEFIRLNRVHLLSRLGMSGMEKNPFVAIKDRHPGKIPDAPKATVTREQFKTIDKTVR
jgi:hypothetical protein